MPARSFSLDLDHRNGSFCAPAAPALAWRRKRCLFAGVAWQIRGRRGVACASRGKLRTGQNVRAPCLRQREGGPTCRRAQSCTRPHWDRVARHGEVGSQPFNYVVTTILYDDSFTKSKCVVLPHLVYPGVALMRQVYIEDSGPRFWNSLDIDLCKIRNCAGGNPHKLNNDIVDQVQLEVDDTISAAAADRAATIPTTVDMGDVTRTRTSSSAK
ncbi:hypothetical protein B0H14DRAFT_2585792 [Mycena olivaceomarginata]|nr:hypothetical protein B0H14DRAFT_2585792 [Mycena olivaceomarginata]